MYYHIDFFRFCKGVFKIFRAEKLSFSGICTKDAKMGLDEMGPFPYNKGEPHTIEHRGAGKPAEIARCACPFNLIRVMPA